MDFGDYGDMRKFIPNYPKLFFTTYEKPKYYDYIPDTFKLQWEDPHKFIPDKVASEFNQKMFINFIHRECFNSCVATGASLTEGEKDCYNKCRNKHLSSLETFKNILLERRRWKGWKNFIAVREYSRVPEEMGTDFPTDKVRRMEIFDKLDDSFRNKQFLGLREALNSDFSAGEEDKKTIFDVYNPERSPVQRPDIYNEYKELNEKYGTQVAELLKQKINLKDWKDVPGEDWTPEDPSAGAEDDTGSD